DRANSAIANQIQSLEQEKNACLKKAAVELARFDAEAARLHPTVSKCISKVGGNYDPENPDPSCIPAIELPPDEAIAAELGETCPSQDHANGSSKVAHVVATAVIGSVVGIAYGVFLGAVQIDTIGSRPLPFVVAAFYGGVLSMITTAFVRRLFAIVSEFGHRKGASVWLVTLALGAVLVLATLYALDANVEQQGLLKNAAMGTATSRLAGGHHPVQPDHSTPYLLASIFVVFAYFGYYALLGIIDGR